MKKSIILLGANSQVGFETCLHLRQRDDIAITPVTRTLYGSSVLRRVGFKTLETDKLDDAALASAFGEADLVVDFGWPKGASARMPEVRKRIQQHLSAISPKTIYVFISTQSVNQLDPSAPRHSEYSLTKKSAEDYVLKEGRRLSRQVFILRLGEVHGAFQRVSKSFISSYAEGDVRVPDLPAHVVFTHTIAEALANISWGKENPGIYTLYEDPKWTWVEMHAYYGRWTGVESSAEPVAVTPDTNRFFGRVYTAAKAFIAAELFRLKDLMEYHTSKYFPHLFRLIRLEKYKREAKSAIGQYISEQFRYPYVQKVEIKGTKLRSLSDTRSFILEENLRIKKQTEELIGLG